MKRLIEVTDASGLESLLGEKVRLMCANYFYSGKLEGVNASFVQLTGAKIVYDTDLKGAASFTGELPSSTWFVQTAAIESFGAEK